MVIKKFLVLFFIPAVFIGCSFHNNENSEYHVAFPTIPERLSTKDADLNYSLFIIKQLYEPLFKFGTNGKPQSAILVEWKILNNSSEYRFCVKNNVAFSNGHLFTSEILKDNLEYFSAQGYLKSHLRSIRVNDSCCDIFFGSSYPQFITDLMSYKMAMIDPSTREDKIAVGISPYSVVEFNRDLIRLKTSNKLKFTDIYFHLWTPEKKEPLYKYDDINMISERYLSPKFDEYMNKYDINLLRTVALIINNKDPLVRKYLFNCIDYDGLRRIIYPKKERFLDIGGILPLGLPGALSGSVKQECPATPLTKQVKVSMITFFPDIVNELSDYLNRALNGLNIKVDVIFTDLNKHAGILRSQDKPYDITVVGLDAPSPSPAYFFDYFTPGDSLWTNVKNTRLEEILKQYHSSTNEDDRSWFMQEANKALLDNFQVLPLLQINKTLYFSKKLKYITSDQLFMGIPTISELQ